MDIFHGVSSASLPAHLHQCYIPLSAGARRHRSVNGRAGSLPAPPPVTFMPPPWRRRCRRVKTSIQRNASLAGPFVGLRL
jgi:hypothetical protein